MGGKPSGAQDAHGFSAAVREGCGLPPLSSLTYQGLFSQHTFKVGKREHDSLVALRTQWAPMDDGSGGVWVGCFLKSCKDGMPRDATPVDLVVVLDISGSMSDQVTYDGTSDARSRLDVSKEALAALLTKLRPDDRLGVATFTTTGEVVQPLDFVRSLDRDALLRDIHALETGGGTTIAAGMDAALRASQDAAHDEGRRHRRVVFLTDMDDANPESLSEMIAAQAEAGQFVSFVGIGTGFKSELAEEVTRHAGANYFCITKNEELQKVVVDDFDWNFFPAAFDVEVACQSDAFDVGSVYGTPCENREETLQSDWHPGVHRYYPYDFKQQARELAFCSRRLARAKLPEPALRSTLSFLSPASRTVIRADTVFPSCVLEDGADEGGLILIQLKPKAERAAMPSTGSVKLLLRFQDADGNVQSAVEELRMPLAPGVTDSAAPPALAKGLLLQSYASVCRRYLKAGAEPDFDAAGVAELHEALEGCRALLARLELAPKQTEQMAPGVLEDLAGFVKIAQMHHDEVVKVMAPK